MRQRFRKTAFSILAILLAISLTGCPDPNNTGNIDSSSSPSYVEPDYNFMIHIRYEETNSEGSLVENPVYEDYFMTISSEEMKEKYSSWENRIYTQDILKAAEKFLTDRGIERSQEYPGLYTDYDCTREALGEEWNCIHVRAKENFKSKYTYFQLYDKNFTTSQEAPLSLAWSLSDTEVILPTQCTKEALSKVVERIDLLQRGKIMKNGKLESPSIDQKKTVKDSGGTFSKAYIYTRLNGTTSLEEWNGTDSLQGKRLYLTLDKSFEEMGVNFINVQYQQYLGRNYEYTSVFTEGKDTCSINDIVSQLYETDPGVYDPKTNSYSSKKYLSSSGSQIWLYTAATKGEGWLDFDRETEEGKWTEKKLTDTLKTYDAITVQFGFQTINLGVYDSLGEKRSLDERTYDSWNNLENKNISHEIQAAVSSNHIPCLTPETVVELAKFAEDFGFTVPTPIELSTYDDSSSNLTKMNDEYEFWGGDRGETSIYIKVDGALADKMTVKAISSTATVDGTSKEFRVEPRLGWQRNVLFSKTLTAADIKYIRGENIPSISYEYENIFTNDKVEKIVVRTYNDDGTFTDEELAEGKNVQGKTLAYVLKDSYETLGFYMFFMNFYVPKADSSTEYMWKKGVAYSTSDTFSDNLWFRFDEDNGKSCWSNYSFYSENPIPDGNMANKDESSKLAGSSDIKPFKEYWYLNQ